MKDLIEKANEIASKWKAYGLPYNAIRDAVLEMAMWQKEQVVKDAINDNDVAYFSEEHVRVTVFAYLQGLSEFVQSTYGVNISAGTITDNIMRNLKGGEE